MAEELKDRVQPTGGKAGELDLRQPLPKPYQRPAPRPAEAAPACSPECLSHRLSYRAGIPLAAAQMICAELARLDARIAALEAAKV